MSQEDIGSQIAYLAKVQIECIEKIYGYKELENYRLYESNGVVNVSVKLKRTYLSSGIDSCMFNPSLVQYDDLIWAGAFELVANLENLGLCASDFEIKHTGWGYYTCRVELSNGYEIITKV